MAALDRVSQGLVLLAFGAMLCCLAVTRRELAEMRVAQAGLVEEM